VAFLADAVSLAAHGPHQSGDKDRRPISNFPITRIKVLEVDADGSETVLLDE
jgi:hypothetical protein